MEAYTGDILVDEFAMKKAILLSHSTIKVDKRILPKFSVEKPKAGPSSGRCVAGFGFGDRRVKLEISDKEERFSLVKSNGRFLIRDRKKDFLEVYPLDISTHAPNQVFISLENKCIYNCLFCEKSSVEVDEDRLLSFVRRCIEDKGIRSVAITSGAFPSVNEQIEKLADFVRRLKRDYDDIYVGVEPLVGSKRDVQRLRVSGADEIKINLQFPKKELFDKICGYIEYEKIFDLLHHAVSEFGRGKVTSNIIFGVGESDEEIIYALNKLADMGVVPNLRLIRLTPRIKTRIGKKLGYRIGKVDPLRIIKLAKIHKKILEREGLTTRSFRTMCFACGCCDMVPFWDV